MDPKLVVAILALIVTSIGVMVGIFAYLLHRRRDQAERRRALLPYYARDLSPAAQQLFLDRPNSWEYRLFSTVLSDEIALHESLLRDYRGGLSWGPRTALEGPLALKTWLQAHFDEAQQFGHNLSALINDELPTAFGPSGAPGDGQAIIDIARKVGDVHRRGLEWALQIRRVSAGPRFQRVLRLSERFIEDLVQQLRDFSHKLASSLQAALADQTPGPKHFELTLKVTVPPGAVEELTQELASLTAELRAFGPTATGEVS